MTGSQRITKQLVRSALPGTMGIINLVAHKAGVTRPRLSEWLHKPENKDVLQELYEEKEKTIDIAEAKLMELVNAKDYKAIAFYLKTQGKSRGYTEKQEIEHQGAVKTVFEVNIQDLPAATVIPKATPVPTLLPVSPDPRNPQPDKEPQQDPAQEDQNDES